MKKWFSVVLVFCFAIIFSVSSVASENSSWTMSEDWKTLSYEDVTYRWYALEPGDRFMPNKICKYSQTFPHPTYNDLDLYVYSDSDQEVMVLSQFQDVTSSPVYGVYITSDVKNSLENFSAGRYASYRVLNREETSAVTITQGLLTSFRKKAVSHSFVKLSVLKDSECYTVYGCDESGCFARACGAVYLYHDDYVYVDYSELNSAFFDSNGNFSYASGSTVKAYCLSDESRSSFLDRLSESAPWKVKTVLPGTFGLLEESVFAVLIVLVVLFVVFNGYMIPLVPVILGIVFGFSEPPLSFARKGWFFLAALGGGWIVLSTVFLLILIL